MFIPMCKYITRFEYWTEMIIVQNTSAPILNKAKEKKILPTHIVKPFQLPIPIHLFIQITLKNETK